MTTNDVFSFATKAMAHFDDVPLGGEVAYLSVGRSGSIGVGLDEDRQPAGALLAWFYGLDDRQMFTFEGSGETGVVVAGSRDGVRWSLHATFTGEDAKLLDGEDLKPAVLVHRLRQVQMRQSAALVGAE